MNGSLTENQAREKFWSLYRETFDDLYRYCARRATTKPVIAFIIKSLYEYALDEIRHGQEIILIDLYKWAYEFFAVQSQPQKGAEMMQQVKRLHDFRDVYDIKTDSGSRAIRREQILENFYNHLAFKEREVLWLTFFEDLNVADRAYVMGMSEEECTTFYYESLKKAKGVVSMASPGPMGVSRIAAYFGGVSSLLKKAKQHEELDVDQEIYASLRGLFSEQFSRRPQSVDEPTVSSAPSSATRPPETVSAHPEPVMKTEPIVVQKKPADPFADITSPIPKSPSMSPQESPLSARASVRPVSSVESSAPANNTFDDLDSDEWLDDEGSFGSSLWQRLQGVLVLVMVVALGSFAYFKFFSLDARVNRLLQDNRVVFSSDFKPEEKVWFAQDALLYLAKNRDYTAVNIHRQDNMVQVNFDIKNTGVESFLLYPQEQTFDADFRWQPKLYMKVRSLS